MIYPNKVWTILFIDFIPLADIFCWTDLLSYFPSCIRFIAEGIKSGGVLVHWYVFTGLFWKFPLPFGNIVVTVLFSAAGISRSATIVIAFLMQDERISVQEGNVLLILLGTDCEFDSFCQVT